MTGLPDPALQPAFYDGVPAKRLIAWLIDMVVVGLLILPIMIGTAFLAVFVVAQLFFVVGFVYRVLTLTGGSATLGMRVMAIEFRDAHGHRFDFGQAFLHTLGYTISVAVAPLQLVSVAMMLLTERGQGLTDMVLGSTALNRQAR